MSKTTGKDHKQQAQTEENAGPLLNRRGELVANQCQRARGSLHFFHLCFYQHAWAPDLGNKNPVPCTDLLSLKELLGCMLLQELDPYKLGLREVLRELAGYCWEAALCNL